MTGKKGDFMETISLNRRSLFSRTSGLLVMLMLLLNLCGCADFLKQLKKDSYNLNTFMNMDQIEKETKEVSDSIVKILDKKDEKALEELFSEESRELCTDFDAGVEYLFDTYEGKSKKVSDYNFGANEINSPQRLTQVVYGSCTVETSKEEYRLYWAKYVRCKGLKERAGLWSIRIVRADEDQDKRGSLLPGIELPEWADTSALVVDLIEIMHSDEGITGDPSSLLSDDLLGKMSPEEKDAFTTLACSINRDTVSTIRLDKKDPNRVFLPFEVLGKGMYVASITCDEKITGLRITEYMKKMPSEKECRAEEGDFEGITETSEYINDPEVRYIFEGKALYKVDSLFGYETPDKKSLSGYTDSEIGGWEVRKITCGCDVDLYWIKGDVCCREKDLDRATSYFRDYKKVEYHLVQFLYGGNKDGYDIEFDEDMFWQIYDRKYTDTPVPQPSSKATAAYTLYRTDEDNTFSSRYLIYIIDGQGYMVVYHGIKEEDDFYPLSDEETEYVKAFAEEYCT